MSRRRDRVATAMAATALVVAASCAGAREEARTAAPVFALDRDVTIGIAEVDPERRDVLAAADLRLLLQELLTEHVAVLSDAMRAAADDGPELEALLEAITTNTDALTVTLGVAYGPLGARAFDQLWTNHIEFFVRYARAAGHGDTTATAEALEQLGDYALDFSSFCDLATGGGAPADAVADLLHAHVDQLRAQTDAWLEGDRATADQLVWEAEQHTTVIAAALAGAIADQQAAAFPGPTAGSQVDATATRQLLILGLLNGSVSVVAAPATTPAVPADQAGQLADATGAAGWPGFASAVVSVAGGGSPTALSESAAGLDRELGLTGQASMTEFVAELVAAASTEDPATLAAARPLLHDLAVSIAAAVG